MSGRVCERRRCIALPAILLARHWCRRRRAMPTSTRRKPDGSTPLQWAVYEGDVAEVRRLIDAGADVSVGEQLRRHADEPGGRGREHRKS